MQIAPQRLLLIGLPWAMSFACAPETPKIQEIRNYQATFLCEDSQKMHVHFVPFNATLDFQGMSVAMTQQPAADGFLYTGEGQSLRARGAEATWTDGRGAVHHCREALTASQTINMPAR